MDLTREQSFHLKQVIDLMDLTQEPLFYDDGFELAEEPVGEE